jgi:hypothetical protein
MRAIKLTACGNPAQNLKIVEVWEPKATPMLTPDYAAPWLQPSRHLCGARQRRSLQISWARICPGPVEEVSLARFALPGLNT